MPLDIPASGVGSQTIRYARAAWDYARDGGDPGLKPTASQQLPNGCLILGFAGVAVDQPIDVGSSTMQVSIGASQIGEPFDPLVNGVGIHFTDDLVMVNEWGSMPISLMITGDGYSAGSLLIYVFYVL